LLHVRDAVAWRLHRLLGDRVVYGSLLATAKQYRRVLKGVVFIGITGSVGKTTTKELLLGMLSQRGRGVGNYSSFNNIEEIAKAMMRSRPTHRFFVTELSGQQPNYMDRPLALVRPSIGIVTVVGDDHSSVEYPREAIAREKSKLVAALPASGTAILNADDELVSGMAARCAGRVITYGLSAGAELRAEEVSSVWPERLQMTLLHRGERLKVHTQLCGTHWIPSVLGAIGAGLAMGMTLQECAGGIARVAPFDGRMQPVSTPEGVTFIRDDYKAPLWTVDAAFDFMKAARAKRKIIVIGELQDVGSRKSAKYEKTASVAQDIAEITIVVGPWASSALKARRRGAEERLRVFSHVRDAAQYLNAITREGDLVLLKGANRQDHLMRIIMARSNDIACWRDDCNRYTLCDECPERNTPSGPPPTVESARPRSVALPRSGRQSVDADAQLIIGLGNPEPTYAGTPHNIGYAVVDRLAVTLGLSWEETPQAWLAHGAAHDGRPVCLIKVRSAMNHTGAALKALCASLSLDPARCILVHDDLDLPLGAVRTRLNGGAGGHRGIASILEAFQSDAFRRVKVGVGRPGGAVDRAQYVLTPFAAADQDAIGQALVTAGARSLELVHTSAAQRQLLER